MVWACRHEELAGGAGLPEGRGGAARGEGRAALNAAPLGLCGDPENQRIFALFY